MNFIIDKVDNTHINNYELEIVVSHGLAYAGDLTEAKRYSFFPKNSYELTKYILFFIKILTLSSNEASNYDDVQELLIRERQDIGGIFENFPENAYEFFKEELFKSLELSFDDTGYPNVSRLDLFKVFYYDGEGVKYKINVEDENNLPIQTTRTNLDQHYYD